MHDQSPAQQHVSESSEAENVGKGGTEEEAEEEAERNDKKLDLNWPDHMDDSLWQPSQQCHVCFASMSLVCMKFG